MDAIDLRNNLLALITAGHDMTALAITWSLYLVALDREVQVRARAVAQDVLGDRAATSDVIPRLGFGAGARLPGRELRDGGGADHPGDAAVALLVRMLPGFRRRPQMWLTLRPAGGMPLLVSRLPGRTKRAASWQRRVVPAPRHRAAGSPAKTRRVI